MSDADVRLRLASDAPASLLVFLALGRVAGARRERVYHPDELDGGAAAQIRLLDRHAERAVRHQVWKERDRVSERDETGITDEKRIWMDGLMSGAVSVTNELQLVFRF